MNLEFAGPARSEVAPFDGEALSGPGLRTFFNIADNWGLSNEHARILLGRPHANTLARWKKNPEAQKLDQNTLERLSYLLGIYKALQILLPHPGAADAWVRQPNDAPLFGGRPALDRMLSGHVADLYAVRCYLDAERGGWS